MRSLDLSSPPVQKLVDDALARALDELRATSAVRLAVVRVVTGAAFLVLAAVLGYGLHHQDWAANVPLLALYTAVSTATLFGTRRAELRTVVTSSAPLVDLLFVFTMQLEAAQLAQHPGASMGSGLGLFVLIVIVAAFSQRPELTLVTTAVAWIAQGVLLHAAGVGAPLVVMSGLVLAVSAAVITWAAQRLEALASRLVAEEMAGRLALARGEELEHANDRIAQANARLEAQHAQLAVAQREAETMSSLLVHDMKQPLASMQGLLDLVSEELSTRPDAGKLVGDLCVARGQGLRLLSMISDLLAIARLEKGSLVARRQRVEVGLLLQGVQRAHLVRAQALHVELTLELEGEPEANLDRELVERMVENLVSNALSFVHAGDRVQLHARRVGATLRLCVRNTGPKVPDEVGPLLFEKFVTKGPLARHNAGLGLYFCRLVAEAHGGAIALVDEPGWNVAFEARLPADEAADTPPSGPRLGSDTPAAVRKLVLPAR